MSCVGVELGPTSWIDVTQERIDAFAAATDDPQWIHVDRERAAAGPFGTTIAHGYLTLSLCVPMLSEVLPRCGRDGRELRRQPRALSGAGSLGKQDSRPIHGRPDRGHARRTAGTIEALVECEGVEKPVCAAELVVLTRCLTPSKRLEPDLSATVARRVRGRRSHLLRFVLVLVGVALFAGVVASQASALAFSRVIRARTPIRSSCAQEPRSERRTRSRSRRTAAAGRPSRTSTGHNGALPPGLSLSTRAA